MTEQVRVELPESLMHAIETVVASKEMPAAERFEAVVLMVFGYALFNGKGAIDPTKYAIPEAQWKQIGDRLASLETTNLRQVDALLAWMNKGPSAYEETR